MSGNSVSTIAVALELVRGPAALELETQNFDELHEWSPNTEYVSSVRGLSINRVACIPFGRHRHQRHVVDGSLFV